MDKLQSVMKQINGTPHNVTEDILGKVTFKKRLFNRKDYVYVLKNAACIPSGYAAVVVNNAVKDSRNPYVSNISQVEDFQEGDVVTINRKGEIIFLYEIQSQHNAIFATERCNHRCIMCPQPPVAQETDKTSFNIKLISLIDKHTKSLGITGGEPTLIGDNLFELIKQIKRYQPKASISLLTNDFS